MKIKFKWKLFSELTTDELYTIIHLRQKVFIVEQDCPYIDADYADQKAYHLLAFIDGVLIGYLRAFKPGFKYLEASIGRIIIASKYRKEGLGKKYVDNEKLWIKTEDQVRKVLEKDYDLFAKYYDISENGNWEGKNILIEKSIKPSKDENEKLKKIKNILLNIREKRPKPFFDDKTQIDLNAYSNGIYVLYVTYNNKTITHKIIKQ